MYIRQPIRAVFTQPFLPSSKKSPPARFSRCSSFASFVLSKSCLVDKCWHTPRYSDSQEDWRSSAGFGHYASALEASKSPWTWMPSTLQLTRPGPNRRSQPPSTRNSNPFGGLGARRLNSEVASFVTTVLPCLEFAFSYVNDWLSASRACAEASPSYSSISLPQASHPAERLTKRCYLSRISGPGALSEDQARQG